MITLQFEMYRRYVQDVNGPVGTASSTQIISTDHFDDDNNGAHPSAKRSIISCLKS